MNMMMCQPSAFTPDQSWHNPQPSFPCPKCGSKDHYKNQCPLRNHLCTACNKYGHSEKMCKKAGTGSCAVCGKENHVTAACRHSKKTCNICNEVGHMEAMCKMASQDNKKQQTNTGPAPKAKDDSVQGWWYCPHCCLHHTLQVTKCTGCNRTRDG